MLPLSGFGEDTMRVIDMHCDTISRLLEKREELLQNTGHLDLKRMKESGYLLQNFALFVELSKDRDPWEKLCALYELYEREMEKNQALIGKVLQYSDIERNEREGKLSALLTVEEGAVCKGEIEKLEELYAKGVRMLTLTWNFPNELGYPNFRGELFEQGFEVMFHSPQTELGLTGRGREFVIRMEELGMIPDVSHLSDAGFYDVAAVTKRPFVASHSNARAVSPCVRNLTDEMIRLLAERGGCMGLNFCPDFLEEGSKGTVEAVVRHAKHIVKVGGIEVLGLGSDFDGIPGHEELPGAQSMDRLYDALKKQGFTESQLEKLFYRNVLRVYQDCLR